jgi:hypothetical protein
VSEVPAAREVVLRKMRPLAPPFHRHIVRSKLVGGTCQAGDRVVVYEVVSTEPEGVVAVTGETVLRFE